MWGQEEFTGRGGFQAENVQKPWGGTEEEMSEEQKKKVCLLCVEEGEDVELERWVGPNHQGAYTEKALEVLP